jgi:hypothetical protein
VNREYVPATLAELWDIRNKQEARKRRLHTVLEVSFWLAFIALDIYLLWPEA